MEEAAHCDISSRRGKSVIRHRQRISLCSPPGHDLSSALSQSDDSAQYGLQIMIRDASVMSEHIGANYRERLLQMLSDY